MSFGRNMNNKNIYFVFCTAIKSKKIHITNNHNKTLCKIDVKKASPFFYEENSGINVCDRCCDDADREINASQSVKEDIHWIKYRHRFAGGTGDWEWKFIINFNIANEEELVKDIHSEYDHSELYRGIDYYFFSVAPAKVLIENMKSSYRIINGHKKRIEFFESQLRQK